MKQSILYRRVKKSKFLDRHAMRANIYSLAEQIRGGEETKLDEYNEAVLEFASLTRNVAPARDTDPIMYDSLCDDWGREPGETIHAGGKREMNYGEMIRFKRGYWR